MRHQTRLSATFDSSAIAACVCRSLAPEESDLQDERSQVTISQSGTTVTIDISSTDLIALRAAINSWTGLLEVAERALIVGTTEV